jgi:hypothetical protein
MRRIFWGFCRNRFLMRPLHYLSSRSDFGFELAQILVIEKWLPDSPSWGVDKFAHKYNLILKDPLHYISSRSNFSFEFADIFVIEKRLADLASRGVADSPTRRVGYRMFKGKLPSSVSLGVADSTTRRVRESGSRWLSTQQVGYQMFKRKLPSSVSLGIAMVSWGVY